MAQDQQAAALDWPRPEVTVDKPWSAGAYPDWLRTWRPHGVELREDGIAITLDRPEMRAWLAVCLSFTAPGAVAAVVALIAAVPGAADPGAADLAFALALPGVPLGALFVPLVFMILRRLRRGDPVIRIDDDGLHIDTHLRSRAFVRWEDVLGIEYLMFDGPQALAVHAAQISRDPRPRLGVGPWLRRRKTGNDRVQIPRRMLTPSLPDIETVLATHERSPNVPQEPDTGTMPQRISAESQWWADATARGEFDSPPSWRAVFRSSRSKRYATPPEFRRAILTSWRRRYVVAIGAAAMGAALFVFLRWGANPVDPAAEAAFVSIAVSAAGGLLNLWLALRPAASPPMRRIVRAYGRSLQLRLAVAMVAYISVFTVSLRAASVAALALAWVAAAVPAALAAPTLADASRRSATVRDAPDDLLLQALSAPGVHWYW